MFPYERSYKQLKKWVKSTRYAVASLARNVVAFMMSVIYHAENAAVLSHQHVGLFDCVTDDQPEVPGDSVLSPYMATPQGLWVTETTLGRRQAVQCL
jgi:hypothetical protein